MAAAIFRLHGNAATTEAEARGWRNGAGAALATALVGRWPWAGWLRATTETSGQSGAVQHGGGRRGRGGGGARRAAGGAEVPPSRRGDAGSPLPAFLRPPGRPGLRVCGLRERLVPTLARRLCLGRQRPDVQLAPSADGDRHGGAVRRSGPGVPSAPRLERPQASLEGATRHPGLGSLWLSRAGVSGRLSLPQPQRDAQHVLAAQLVGAGHHLALLLPVAGWFQRLHAALGSHLAPGPLQARPRLLWFHHPHAVCGFVYVRHQREALLQPCQKRHGVKPSTERRREVSDSPPQEERDNGVQAPAHRGCLCQHIGAPDPPLWGAGAGRPGQAELEASRCRLPRLLSAPARRRALTLMRQLRSLPALPGLPALCSPTLSLPCLLCRPCSQPGTPAACT